jgi:uncharacterized protein (DUF927 family)
VSHGEQENDMSEILTLTPLQALALGWSIMPANRNKSSMLQTWKEYQERRATETELETWLKWKPPAWALITGSVSGRFTLDFDPPEGLETFNRLGIPAHRSTPSGGYHVDISHPLTRRIVTLNGKIKGRLWEQWPGLDIRGDGGYVLFSGRTDKGEYTWLQDPEAHPLDHLPKELQRFLGLTENSAPPLGLWSPPDTEDLINRALNLVAAQGRNASGFWLATQLRDNRFPESAAATVMQSYRARCPEVNTKGEAEEYRESEMMATLKQAYDRSARDAWGKPNGQVIEIAGNRQSAAAPEIRPQGQISPTEEEEQEEEDTHFSLTKDGVFHTHQEKDRSGNLRPVTIKVCSPLEILAYARDPNSESWGRLLHWTDADSKEHSWVVPMAMLVGNDVSFRETLADGGLDIGASPKNLLAQYIISRRPQRRLVCAPQVGWLERSFITPEWVVPEDADVAYQSMGHGEHFYRVSGTLQEWIDNVSRPCAGNPLLVFLIGCSLAGPLMRELNVQGGGFALEGDSSIGKSTALIVAGSVWGGGGGLGFCRTFAATHAALESIAELHNDGCLLLDEMALARPDELEETIYMLSNGFGRSRNNRQMTGRRTLQWRLMILANGEVPPSSHAAKAGRTVRGGAEARLPVIPADSGKWGVFEDLHGASDARVFAETLDSAARRYYGQAARAFIDYLLTHWRETVDECNKFIEKFIASKLPEGSAPEVRRILRRCALATAVGEKCTEAGLTGWPKGEAKLAGIDIFERLIERRGGVEGADKKKGFELVCRFIATQRSRLRSTQPAKDADGKIIPERVPNSIGYWKEINDEIVYLIHPDVFVNEICAGFNAQQILKDLRDRKLLLINESKGFTRKETVPLESGEPIEARFYSIKAKILE